VVISEGSLGDYSSKLSGLLVDFYNMFNAWEVEAVNSLDTKLSILEVHTIEALGRKPSLKMRELAEILGVSTASVTAIVDKLEEKGFAVRRTTPADRRVYLLELTKKGFELYEMHSNQHKKMAEMVVTSIPGDQVAMFVEMLRIIVDKSS
jgi:DNA-binding MarR family transcriptional regulator